MKNFALGVVLAAAFAAPAAAQDAAPNQQVIAAMESYTGGRYVAPECGKLDDTGHFKVIPSL